jgi:predicted enzyme related to lactoylglutathione lyase
MRYTHTNLIAGDWRRLADFYIKVFECRPIPPERDLKGRWLDEAVNLEDAHITGIHLQLPGYTDGPTLEIFQYSKQTSHTPLQANHPGLRHLAFTVPDIEKTIEKIKENGGKRLGKTTRIRIDGVGELVFAYLRDPEGNIIEVQEKPE